MRALVFLFTVTVCYAAGAEKYSDSIFTPGADAVGFQPLTTRQDLSIHLKQTVGTGALVSDVFNAALNQWKNDPGAWGRGAEGYAKRYATQFGRDGVRNGAGFGLDQAFHTDPRIFRSERGSVKGRLYVAVSQVVIARTNSGGRTFAFSNVGSAFIAGEVQTIWMPRNDAHVTDGLVNAGVMLMGDAIRNVAKEFYPDVKRKLLRTR